MKQITLILFMLTSIFTQHTVSAANISDITAKSAIVIEASTGSVLYGKNIEERRYPASTTKIMTLITALEHGNPNSMVTASPNAANTEGSTLWLAPGEQLRMLDMLYGIMLVSGNDATVAVAENISGSVDRFAKLMTEKAHMIGAVHTNFTNSSGLPDPNHYTTAYDLALITAYGYKNPLFAEIVGTKNKIIPWSGKDHARDLYNENRMLWLYEGANGVKTGYTDAAGRCLVSAAKRGNVQLIAVVLDSDYMWDDSIALLDYGFKQVNPVKVVEKDEILKTIKVTNGILDSVKLITSDNIIVPLRDQDKDQLRTVVEAPDKIEAPVKSGQKIGKVKVMYKDKEVAATDLLAEQPVERKSFFGIIWGSLWSVLTFFIRNFA